MMQRQKIKKSKSEIRKLYAHKLKLPYYHIKPSFDPYLTTETFIPVKSTEILDEKIEKAVSERLKQITPTDEEICDGNHTASKLLLVLNRLKQNPYGIDAFKIQDFAIVGSARMRTMLKGFYAVDISVILSTLPAKASLSALSNKILEELQRIEPIINYQVNIGEAHLEIIDSNRNDVTNLLITTSIERIKILLQNIHIQKRLAYINLDTIEHVKFFDSQTLIYSTSVMNDIRNLVRLFKDLRNRFEEFRVMSSWMILVISHYAITHTTNHRPLPIHIAFKRMLQVLSGGICLPYTFGIRDPCFEKMPIHGRLHVFDQEKLTLRAQTLLRALSYEVGIRYILGLDGDPSKNWDEQFSQIIWNTENVIFRPSVSVVNYPVGDDTISGSDISDSNPVFGSDTSDVLNLEVEDNSESQNFVDSDDQSVIKRKDNPFGEGTSSTFNKKTKLDYSSHVKLKEEEEVKDKKEMEEGNKEKKDKEMEGEYEDDLFIPTMKFFQDLCKTRDFTFD